METTTGYARILRLREELCGLRLPKNPDSAAYERIWLKRMGVHAEIAAIMREACQG